MVHNLLMLNFSVRQSNRFFLHDLFYLLCAILGFNFRGLVATAATAATTAAGIKKYDHIILPSR